MSTSTDLTLPSAGRIGQATAVEQSRAVAEVQAAIVVAQRVPRVVASAVSEMEASCQQTGLAERAFYRYPRGGQTVTGPSIHLAKELARCWGNIQYSIDELRRDDDVAQSEMKAWAWDVQTNTRASQTFVVPHKRDSRRNGGTPEVLIDMRDIYENNANNGARRLREAIFSVLPPWYVERAKELCHQTIEKGGGDKPLAQRAADAVKAFEGLGVTLGQMEQKIGRPTNEWTAFDLAQLHITYTSLKRGELTREEEFPQASLAVTAAEIVASAPPEVPAPVATEKADEPKPPQRGRARAATLDEDTP